MTLPITERIILAVVAQLGTITTAAGYNTQPKVLRSQSTINDTDIPALDVWALRETVSGDQSGYSLPIQLTLQIDAAVAANESNTGAQLELIKADVKRAVLSLNLVTAINDSAVTPGPLQYTGATALPRLDGANAEGVSLTFTIDFREKRGDPTRST